MTPRSRSVPSVIGILAAGLALVTASCRGGPTLYPVRGQVFYLDKPAEGATVIFHPVADGGVMASGAVGPDGAFALSTYPHGEGAMPGEYEVTVTRVPPDSRGTTENLKSDLPAEYATRAKSKLRATVQAGPTVLEPFRLTK